MKHDSDFHFADPVLVIAFVCDLSVENEEVALETYLNFYKHLALDLRFTLAILATQDSYLEPKNIELYKQIQKRLAFMLLGTS